MKDRLINAVRETVELNLRFTSAVFNLSKDYVKAFDGILREKAGNDKGGDSNGLGPDARAGSNGQRRPPILLVGTAGERATGAFAVNNTSDRQINASFVVQGELAANVEVPQTFAVPARESRIARVAVSITKEMEENRDYHAALHAPGLSNEAIDLIVRRVPG